MKDLKKDIQNPGTEKPEIYEAPTIEIIEVEVERGFAQSVRSLSAPDEGLEEDDEYTW